MIKGIYNYPLLGAWEATPGIQSLVLAPVQERETGERLERLIGSPEHITSEETLRELGLFLFGKEKPKG